MHDGRSMQHQHRQWDPQQVVNWLATLTRLQKGPSFEANRYKGVGESVSGAAALCGHLEEEATCDDAIRKSEAKPVGEM